MLLCSQSVAMDFLISIVICVVLDVGVFNSISMKVSNRGTEIIKCPLTTNQLPSFQSVKFIYTLLNTRSDMLM